MVTHLAQVAALADHHLVVSKSDDGGVTTTRIAPVHGNGRIDEVSRMLSGRADSATARKHARELLQGVPDRSS